ncbi:MAG: hypothetical protein Q9208_006751 [Pyrenodesmia sp. 3 TL-2023]
MAVKDRTHDISLISHHVKDVDTLSDILNEALSAAFPRVARSRYHDVYVLLLSWEDDDLGVQSEVNELDHVFENVFRYKTNRWRIPTSKSHNALVRRIMEALEEAEVGNSLLIVYYGGHGYMNEDRHCVWLCNQKPGAATLLWSSIQTMLEQDDTDVLILLDCCAAASSAGGSGKGITELIAACGFESSAPGVGDHSFTRSLIEELRYYGRRPGSISSAFLHNKVLARAMKSWNPRYASEGAQEYASDESQEWRRAPERRRTPIHIHLADQSNQRCIELMPLPIPLSSVTHGTPSSTGSSAPSTEGIDMSDPSDSSNSSLTEAWPDPSFSLPKVLIRVALEEDQFLRTGDWLEWLESIPALANSVRIESVYKSNSTLLLLSLPVAVWDLLPKDPAISFISFVQSCNLMHRENPNARVHKKIRSYQPKQERTTIRNRPPTAAAHLMPRRRPDHTPQLFPRSNLFHVVGGALPNMDITMPISHEVESFSIPGYSRFLEALRREEELAYHPNYATTVGHRNWIQAVLPRLLFSPSAGPSLKSLGFQCTDKYIANIPTYKDGVIKSINPHAPAGIKRSDHLLNQLGAPAASPDEESQVSRDR